MTVRLLLKQIIKIVILKPIKATIQSSPGHKKDQLAYKVIQPFKPIASIKSKLQVSQAALMWKLVLWGGAVKVTASIEDEPVIDKS